MEVNQEVSGHGSNPNEEQQEMIQINQQTAASRSYECNFCKKGFSNAQALGGHMNIHRKDKAKLKHASSSSKPNCYNNNNNNNCYYKPLDIMITSDRDDVSAAKWHRDSFHESSWLPSIRDGSHNNVSELKQLSSFVEKTMRTDLSFHHHQDFQQSSSHGVAELDLELRLGHHVPPNKSSSSSSSSVSMGTRKFF